jgi:peptidoglycan/xylan/chitin deacetylase (PgdA/CDA1 family)
MTQAKPARPAKLAFEEPILSVCFDDFPHSALEGARLLETYGGRGTFYASAGLSRIDGPSGKGFEASDLTRLAKAGHEVGCHTYSHRDCARVETFETLLDLAKNRDALAAMGHEEALTTLAYPYGETSTELKAVLPPRIRAARGVSPGLNVGRADLLQLRAFGLFGDGLRQARVALPHAAKRRAWMIVFTHDVADNPSPWGTSSADLDAFLNQARAFGFALLPVSKALERGRS